MLILCSSTLKMICAECVTNNMEGDGRGLTDGTTPNFFEGTERNKSL